MSMFDYPPLGISAVAPDVELPDFYYAAIHARIHRTYAHASRRLSCIGDRPLGRFSCHRCVNRRLGIRLLSSSAVF